MRRSMILLGILAAVALVATTLAAVPASAAAPRTPDHEVSGMAASTTSATWYSFCSSSVGVQIGTAGSLVPHAGIVDGCSSYAFYDDEIATTGWSYLHVESDHNEPSNTQAYAAGFAEGYLTAKRIVQSLPNMIQSSFANNTVPANVYAWMAQQQQWVSAQAAANPADMYFQQAMFSYVQVSGIVDGVAAAGASLSMADALLLNMQAEVSDIQAAISPSYRESIDVLSMHDLKRVKSVMAKNSHCSALIRLSPDGSDLFSTHTTWTDYSQMLRVYKYYSLAPLGTRATGVQFSSYPAAVSSIDDYYQTSQSLIVIETTNNVANMSLYDAVTQQSVPTFARAALANRLASSGAEWAEYFSKHNGGTYNNQWMIVDNKQFTPKTATAAAVVAPGTLWVASQIPGLVVSKDVTDVLVQRGFWPSYNIPYFPDLWSILGYESLVKQYGSWGEYLWSYDNSFRALLFARDAPKVASMGDMQSIIQSNKFQTDPLSKGCAELAIASRMDLSTGPFSAESANGAIDAKVSSASWMNSQQGGMQVLAKSGPTVESQAPFTWSTSAFSTISHVGLPDTFNFDWQTFVVAKRPSAASNSTRVAVTIATE